MSGRVAGVSMVLTVVVTLGLALQGPACFITLGWWFMTFAFIALGYGAGRELDQHRAKARAEDVATLERSESVLTALDDAPPPLPPAIPVSMRDPAFQQKLIVTSPRGECAICGLPTARAFCSPQCQVKAYVGVRREVAPPGPLVAERRFTLLTHCPQGHVATHWLGATTDDHIERICRFEQCAATWLEKR